MLKKIKAFFDAHLLPDADAAQADGEHRTRLAVAALLLEMMQMDGDISAEERAAVETAVLTCFDLTSEETSALLALAEAERRDATDYFQFTSLINASYSPEQKVRLVEALWHIAYADEGLHRHEEHLARKLADLLHVPHGAFIAAKMKAAG
ncbi:TerB family tellurite resistance protein [Thiohalocapsa marina]|uniref:TerB family tellurite resistance protein n=1 Tax=Thiohalocapsa marina TaxID=424902 RepID=A0A5M8FMC1_9GAMM|nr:TerB family tellurite resistance protein [Thiohalocapsa marina]KAA6186063.1 TerB family tellurite resistance protein [Thiohalocapsa marina]